MSLSSGTKLAHYQILEPIGRGGMGEVYRARDLKLERDVAIKVLTEELAFDVDRLRRFQREARTVAALNHPNIVTIYSVEEADSLHFITMELVAGTCLDEHLPKGRLPLEQFLEIALPLADAIAAAHEQGITHRDIKPQNIIVGEDGRDKVLDFGLARIARSSLDEKGGSNSAQLTASRALGGVILGTVPYMSPEQAEGRPLDERSDVFSLGVVLYEMATGRHPFRRESAVATLSSILKDNPAPVRDLNPALPERLCVLIERCLKKSPQERYASGQELCGALAWLERARAGPSLVETPPFDSADRRTFVGREVEERKLSARLEELARGRGTLVLIGGEPGVGKTRIAEKLLAGARERNMLALTGCCYEERGAPYNPFLEIVEQLTRELPRAVLRHALGRAASDLVQLIPELRHEFDDIPPPIELPPEQQRRHLLNGFLGFFRRLSASRGVVALLDDLHWADDATLALLEHLAAHLPDFGFLALGTYRDVELEVGKPFAKSMATLVRKKQAERLPLKRLKEEAVGDLLEAFGGAPPPGALLRAVFEETEGNPFFVGEVFQHLSEEGKLFDEKGAWKDDLKVDELDVPEGVRLVIGRRLERLQEATPKLLAVAAVCGPRFDLKVVEDVSGLPADPFLEAIEEAEAARLIAPEATSRGATYSFTHELVRQTLLSSLSLPRRQKLHLHVAEAIERANPNHTEDHASDLAHHLYQAGGAADLAKTVRYLELTADTALASGAPEEALSSCKRALALDENDEGGRRTWLLYKRASALRALGDWAAASVDWLAALPLFERTRDREIVARICYDLAYTYLWENRTADALKLVERGLRTVGDTPDAPHCLLLSMAAIALEMDEELSRALKLSDRAMAIAEGLGDERLIASEVLVSRMYLLYEHAMSSDFRAVSERAIELATRSGSPWDLSTVLGLAQAGWPQAGELGLMEQYLDESKSLSVREGNVASLLYATQSNFILTLASGDLPQANDVLTTIIDLCDEAGFPWVSFFHAMRGTLALWRGAASDASESFDTAVRIAPGLPAWEGFELGRQLLGMVYLGETVADRLIEKLKALLPMPGEKTGIGRWAGLLCLVESLASLGRNAEAGELYPLVGTMLERGNVLCFELGLVEKAAGIAAASTRNWEEATSHYAKALRLAHDLPHRVEQAEVRRWYAQMLHARGASGDLETARRLEGEAVGLYRELGMPGYVAMVEARDRR